MSLEERLNKKVDEAAVRASWNQTQVAQYRQRQLAYIQALFVPILSLALERPVTKEEVIQLYIENNSGIFSKMYMECTQHLLGKKVDPTYEAGIAVIIRAYANKKDISQTQAGIDLLNAKIFESYKSQYHAVYRPLVNHRLAKQASHQKQAA